MSGPTEFFLHYLNKSTIFGIRLLNVIFLNFSTVFVRILRNSKKNSERYHKYIFLEISPPLSLPLPICTHTHLRNGVGSVLYTECDKDPQTFSVETLNAV